MLTEDRIESDLIATIEALRGHPEDLRQLSQNAFLLGEINRKGTIAELILQRASKES